MPGVSSSKASEGASAYVERRRLKCRRFTSMCGARLQVIRDPYSGAGAGKVTITATALVSPLYVPHTTWHR